MRVDFYGMAFETPRVTVYLWSPWRASAIEHRLFDGVRTLGNFKVEQDADEIRLHLEDPKLFKQALTGMVRVLKGWQEEAEQGRERRTWRWLMEGDTDDNGYDHAGEPACIWAFLRLSLDRGNLEENDRAEDIDMNGFGLRFWPVG